MTTPAAELERVARQCVPGVLSTLVRRHGHFEAAEDAVQEALVDAAHQWSTTGVPDNPCGWLTTVASRRLVDRWRSEQARTRREQTLARTASRDHLLVPTVTGTGEHDDSLTLFLLCCHPALTKSAQVALTLRAIGGLSTAQISRAFLVPQATMAQRISRAKARLRQVGARFALPAAKQLPHRVATTGQVLYLIFTEGHTATSGGPLSDNSLADEAIRLTRQLHRYLPAHGEVSGLLALMLLVHARRGARTGPDGSLVPLAEQDRSLWDQNLIAEGARLIEATLPAGRVGPYQLQAAIAAVHADARRAADTDWAQIKVLYGMLTDLAPSPVVTLNRAVAVAMVNGPAAALAMVEPLLSNRQMRHSHRLHAVHAHLLEMDGRIEEARTAYAASARLATSIPEQRYLNAKAAQPEA